MDGLTGTGAIEDMAISNTSEYLLLRGETGYGVIRDREKRLSEGGRE